MIEVTGHFPSHLKASLVHLNITTPYTMQKRIPMMKGRFYRDPLRKVDFICSKTVIRLIFYGIKISENKVLTSQIRVTVNSTRGNPFCYGQLRELLGKL